MIYRLCCLALMLFVLQSCKKENETSSQSPPVVYVVGGEETGTTSSNGGVVSSNAVAKLWKDGQVYTLASASNSHTEAMSVFVSGSDVYVAGYEYQPANSINIAKLWKNGVATNIPNGTKNAQLTSVFVSGSDVYAAGFEFNGNYTVAKLWKNGVATTLAGGVNTHANVNGIFVSGNDVYALIQEYGTANGIIKVSKNGVISTISTANTDAYANSLTVSGNDVYVSGTEKVGNMYKPFIWKNGQKIAINSTSGTTYGEAGFVQVVNNNVYVILYESDSNNNDYYRVLKNGAVVTNLTGANNATVDASSLFVLGNDVYVCGSETINSKASPVYWKNGSIVRLTSSSVNDAWAYSIFVK